MPAAHLDVKVTADVNDLFRKVGVACVPLIHEACRLIADRSLPKVIELVGLGMRKSPEFESLASGQLRAEFGLGTAAGGEVEGRQAAEDVIHAIQASVRVETLPVRGDILGGVAIGVFKEGFTDALSAKWASYTSVNPHGEAHLIAWLEWLSFKGDAVVLTGVELLMDYQNRAINTRSMSRTGKAIMIRRDWNNPLKSSYNRSKGRSGPSVWKVPPEYSGTEDDNWLTRVAADIAPGVALILQEEAASI